MSTNRFFVVSPRLEEVRLGYLFHMLRQPAILCLLKRQPTGEISQTIPWSAFERVSIPCPKPSQQDRIMSEIEKIEEGRKKLMAEVNVQEQQILSLAGDSIPVVSASPRKLARQGYDYIAFL